MPRHRPPTSGRPLARLLALLLLLAPVGGSAASPPGARAQSCGAEREPNDVEAEIQPQTGLFCVAGTLANDDQDLFLWTVDAKTAARPVVLSVTGVPTTVTTARLLSISSEPGAEPVLAGSPLLSVTANPGDAGPVTSEALIDAGSYIVGISRSGTADLAAPPAEGYTLRVSAGAPLPDDQDEEPNDDATTATAVDGAFAVSGDLQGSVDTFAWTLSTDEAAQG